MPSVESETIELRAVSKFVSGGIDQAIASYEKLFDLHSKLNNLTIRVHAEGFAELNRELTGIQVASARIATMKGFDQMNRQITNMTRNIGLQKKALAEATDAHIKRNYEDEVSKRGGGADAASGLARRERVRLERMQKDIDREQAMLDRTERMRDGFLKATQMQKIAKASPATVIEETSEAKRKMDAAEQQMAGGVKKTTGAIDGQSAATKKKALETDKLTGSLEKAKQKEKEQADQMAKNRANMEEAMGEEGEGGTGGGLLYTQTNAEDEIVAAKFQKSPSETTMVRGESEVTTKNNLAEATEKARAAQQKYDRQMNASRYDRQAQLQYSKDYVKTMEAQREALERANLVGENKAWTSVTGKLGKGESNVAKAEADIARQRGLDEAALQRLRSAALIKERNDAEKAAKKQADAKVRATLEAEKAEMAAKQRVAAAEERQSNKQLRDRQRAQAAIDAATLEEMGKREKAAEKLAAKEAAERLQIAEAEAARQGFKLAPDAKVLSTAPVYENGRMTSQTTTYQQIVDGEKQKIAAVEGYNEAGQRTSFVVRQINKDVTDLGRTGDWAARSFLHNTFVVGAWAASVGTFYAGVGIMVKAFTSSGEIERKFATTKTVFHDTEEEAMRLRDSVLELAAAEGRTADEAMDAATKFSRLGLSRVEVIEAVTAALKASNIAQISTAESADYLSAILVGYGLHAKDLHVVLNQLNAIAISYNVTNADMLEGISRVSSIAQRAKLPLQELMGIIGAGVGYTGRPGSEFGNAMKAMIVTLGTPSKQKKLSENFGIEVKDDAGEMKTMSRILAEVYEKYTALTSAEQANMLQMIGQKQQSSRLAAVLDNYVQSQVLSIRAQTDQNSAERENLNIRSTMSSQLQTLESEFARFSTNMIASGDSWAMTSGIQTALKLIADALRLMADHPTAMTAIVGVITLMAGRLLLLAANFEAAEGKGNIFTNSCKQVKLAVTQMMEAMAASNAEMRVSIKGFFQGGVAARIAAVDVEGAAVSFGALGTAVGFAASSILKLLAVVPELAAISLAMWGVTKVFESMSADAEKANDKLTGLNDEIERSNNLANAAGQSARLFETIGKAAPNLDRRGFMRAAEGVSEVAAPGDKERQSAIEKELEDLHERGRLEEIQAKLKAYQADYTARANVEREKSLDLTRQMLSLENANLSAIQRQIEAKNKLGRDTGEERIEERQITDRIKALSEQRSQQFSELGDDEPEEEPETPASKGAQGTVSGLEKGIEDFASKTPAYDTTDKLNNELNALRAKKQLLEANAALAKKEYDDVEGVAAARTNAARKELEAAHNRTLDAKYMRLYGAKDKADAELTVLQEEQRQEAEERAGREFWHKPTQEEKQARGWKRLGNVGNRIKKAGDYFIHEGIEGPGEKEKRIADEKKEMDDAVAREKETTQRLQAIESKNAAYYGGLKAKQAALDAATAAEKAATAGLREKSDALADATRKADDYAKQEAELAAQLRVASAADAQEKGIREAKYVGDRTKYGGNQSEKLWNQSRGGWIRCRALARAWMPRREPTSWRHKRRCCPRSRRNHRSARRSGTSMKTCSRWSSVARSLKRKSWIPCRSRTRSGPRRC